MGRALLGLGLVLVLGACGGNAQDSSNAAGSGGAPQGGGAGQNAGEPGAAGEAGANPLPEPPVADLTGRWGMFAFEDPLGVSLIPRGTALIGEGCASGAPPPDDLQVCGPVIGNSTEQHASFAIQFFDGTEYRAEVTVSADGQRMTGRFKGTGDWFPYPSHSMTWLRVADGEPWLVRDRTERAEDGNYDLFLIEAADGGQEFTRDQVYRFSQRQGVISGSLGAFWHTESRLSFSGNSREVGPVPVTAPELAVSMSIQQADGVVQEISAVTGSGHHYRFRALRGE